MAVALKLYVYHTPSVSIYDVTPSVSGPEIRFKRADNSTADLVYPVPVPASGINYSWRKPMRLQFFSGLAAQVSNLRWYAASAPGDWAGTVSLYVGLTPSLTAGSYGSSSDESTQVGFLTNADAYPSGSPLTINSGTVITTPSIPGFGTQDYLVQQMGVYAGTPSGVKSPRTCYYRYDEI